MKISHIFIDVEGTLLYKKALYSELQRYFVSMGISVPREVLKERHIQLIGVTQFPNKTTKQFYRKFNAAFLYSLGIIPTAPLIKGVYAISKKVPWVAYGDVGALAKVRVPISIISNWDRTLESKLARLVHIQLKHIFSSAGEGIQKPDHRLYSRAFCAMHVPPREIMYVGDSIRLDIEPAAHFGVRTILLDRDNRFPWYAGARIRSLNEISALI